MQEECHVGPAQAGDQTEILQLLSGLPSPPSRAEFHASVDHPEHDSANRLVARLAGRIVGHIEIAPRSIMIGAAPVKAAALDRVALSEVQLFDVARSERRLGRVLNSEAWSCL